ncbi:hypothetical protein GGI43DRAFT_381789 [Trichoderma evansii]
MSSTTDNEYGSQSTHKPSLEALPTEIILQILCELTDLDALYNLIRASPVSSRIFDHHAHEVMETVLPMCLLKIEIQHLVRGVILARSSALPFNNLHDFKELFEEQTLYTHDAFRSPPHTLPSESLTAASLESIRSGLATACRISALTYTCLEFYLERLRDKSFFNPYHCGIRQYPLYIFLRNVTHSWTRSVGKPVRANYDRPPSWVEEMRVARVLWMMQLVGEVQRLAIRDPDGLGWSPEDIEEVARMTPEGFVTCGMSSGVFTISGGCPYFEGMEEEGMTVYDYLQQLGGEEGESSQRSLIDYYRLPRPPAIEARSWTTQKPKPCMRLTKFGNVYDLGNTFISADPPIESLELLIRDPHPKLPLPQVSWYSGQRPMDADTSNLGVDCHRNLAFRSADSPLPNVQFDVFRPFGFALWDDTRMRSMRLVGKHHDSSFTAAQFFVWRSLVPEEEIARSVAYIEIYRKHEFRLGEA